MDPFAVAIGMVYLSICVLFGINPFWMVSLTYKAVSGREERKAISARLAEEDERDKRIQLAHDTRDTEEQLKQQGSFDLPLTECEQEYCTRCHPVKPVWDHYEIEEEEPDPEPVRPNAVPEDAGYNVVAEKDFYTILEWTWVDNTGARRVYRQRLPKKPEIYEVRASDGTVLVRYDGPDRAFDPVGYTYMTYGYGRGYDKWMGF